MYLYKILIFWNEKFFEASVGYDPGMEMATHSTILAWRSPWRKEPGGLQSMALQRFGHD